MSQDYFVRPGYVPRLDVNRDSMGAQEEHRVAAEVVYQPHAYRFAASLGRRAGCTTVIDIGTGDAGKLVELADEFACVGIDLPGSAVANARRWPRCQWIDCDLEIPVTLGISEQQLRDAVIVCADVIEHLVDPRHLLELLRRWLEVAPFCVLTTPERDLVRGPDHSGPPPNPAHVREWNQAEFYQLLENSGLTPRMIGLTASDTLTWRRETIIAGIEGGRLRHSRSVRRPHLFVKHVPLPSDAQLDPLVVKDAMQRSGQGDWLLFLSDGEVAASPWRDVPLHDAIADADAAGFDVVDFTVALDGVSGSRPQAGDQLTLSTSPRDIRQLRAWKVPMDETSVSTAQASRRRSGLRVYPYNFLLYRSRSPDGEATKGLTGSWDELLVERLTRVALF